MLNTEVLIKTEHESRNRDTDVENKCMDTKGKGGWWDELGDWD